ncbi:MAG: hypothetical protein KBC47_02400 [Candidatus Peribacteraceae bacterium]|nr:hypothetical protein [Candidatus Peribacteraceae bacterium]
MTQIVFLEVDAEDRTLVASEFPDAVIFEGPKHDQELIEACKDAEIVSCFIHSPFPENVLSKLPKLQLLCTRSVGYDHIDYAACKKRGVTVCNVPDYGSHVIAEHVFALILSTLRHIPEADKKVESGVFDYHGLRGIALRGKTLGIVGTGKIGRVAAEIAHGFGMKILAADQCRTVDIVEKLGVTYVSMDELLRSSDIVTLHVPETKETNHLINAAAFELMKNGAVLVNTARGGLIDSEALLTALKSGKLAYALLDVLEHETNFERSKELVAHPNVVATPHIAFYADDSMKNMYADSFKAIHQHLEGKVPDHTVRTLVVVCDMPAVKAL